MAKIDVYERIKHHILSGEVEPGSVMIERALAEELSVSRVPVREALKKLLCEGLLVSGEGKALLTREYNEQEIHDLYVYRENLDGLAARLFTHRAESMQVRYLEMVYDEMTELREHFERIDWEHHDAEFHHVIARGTRNERIIRAVKTIYEECFFLNSTLLYKGTNIELDSNHLDEVLAEHRAILDAIIARDADAADVAARASVINAAARIMSVFASRRRLTDHRGAGSGR